MVNEQVKTKQHKVPLTAGEYIKKKRLSLPAQAAAIFGTAAVLSAAIALLIQHQKLDGVFAFFGSGFEVAIDKTTIQEVCYVAAVPLAVVAISLAVASFFLYRTVPQASELKRKFLEIVVAAPDQYIITKDKLMSEIGLKVKRTGNVALITSANVYLSEFIWDSPEVLKFIGAKAAIVSGETLLLGYSEDREEAIQAVYKRTERKVRP
jgi:hypothetical protein